MLRFFGEGVVGLGSVRREGGWIRESFGMGWVDGLFGSGGKIEGFVLGSTHILFRNRFLFLMCRILISQAAYLPIVGDGDETVATKLRERFSSLGIFEAVRRYDGFWIQ